MCHPRGGWSPTFTCLVLSRNIYGYKYIWFSTTLGGGRWLPGPLPHQNGSKPNKRSVSPELLFFCAPCLWGAWGDIFLLTYIEARPKEWSDRGRFLPLGASTWLSFYSQESYTLPISGRWASTFGFSVVKKFAALVWSRSDGGGDQETSPPPQCRTKSYMFVSIQIPR